MCGNSSCDNHLTAEEARAAAREEGLELVPSNNGTGFQNVFRSPGFKKAPAHPFLAVVYGPRRTSLGKFATAEHAALACARHFKKFSGATLGAAGASRQWGGPLKARNTEAVAEEATVSAGSHECPGGALDSASCLVPSDTTGNEAAAVGDTWWKRHSEERARIDALSGDEVEKEAEAHGLELTRSTRNKSGYAGVFKRSRKSAGAADRYEALWAPGQKELERLGLKSNVSFGTWERPDQAALVLALESKRILDASGRKRRGNGGAGGSLESKKHASLLMGLAKPAHSPPCEGPPAASPATTAGSGESNGAALGAVAGTTEKEACGSV